MTLYARALAPLTARMLIRLLLCLRPPRAGRVTHLRRMAIRCPSQAVQTAINQLWQLMLRLHGREADERLFCDDYVTMSRKLYLVLKVQEREEDIDPDDCMESLEDDWEVRASFGTIEACTHTGPIESCGARHGREA